MAASANQVLPPPDSPNSELMRLVEQRNGPCDGEDRGHDGLVLAGTDERGDLTELDAPQSSSSLAAPLLEAAGAASCAGLAMDAFVP